MKRVLVTGGQGFIGSYLCKELLDNGYEVYSVDDFSKYGSVVRAHDKHPHFHLIKGDVKRLEYELEVNRLEGKFKQFDYIIALAAKIGGISYFHQFAYDLFSENEGIMKATYDFAVKYPPKKVVVISSSMVYEETSVFPTPENEVSWCLTPSSSYGRQKLVCEWWAKAAYEQYKIPYTIVRPFNAVGVGEDKALGDSEITSGNIKLMLSHVLPDLVNKCLQGQNPLHILGDGKQIRCYTNGKDIARGIRLAMESPNTINDDFNISVEQPTSVLELAEKVWNKINPDKPFEYICDEPFEYDVRIRQPSIEKSKKLLKFEANISLDDSIQEVIDYMKTK